MAEKQNLNEFGERVLEDYYPVHISYLYVADGKVIRSPLTGTIKDLKQELKVNEVRNCQIFRRNLS